MGLRASGKSTLARELSRVLAMPMLDLDDVVAAAVGCASAGEVIGRIGLAGFRAHEARCLARVLSRRARVGPIVLALGGGTPTAPRAAALLRRARTRDGAIIVYIRADASTLARRQRASPVNRPRLTGLPLDLEVRRLLRQRDAVYRRLSTATLRVDRLTPRDAVAALVGLVALTRSARG
jgi:shikimate kinase